jgi:hypothetical protein
MDFGDIGLQATEARTEALIQEARKNAEKTPEANGECNNKLCGLETDKPFCSPECRDEYDRLRGKL